MVLCAVVMMAKTSPALCLSLLSLSLSVVAFDGVKGHYCAFLVERFLDEAEEDFVFVAVLLAEEEFVDSVVVVFLMVPSAFKCG